MNVNTKNFGSVTLKIGGMNYNSQIPLGGWDNDLADSKLFGFMSALSIVSQALPATGSMIKFRDPSPIPPNTRGKGTKSFKFLVVGEAPIGQEAPSQYVTIRVPEYTANSAEEQSFISYLLNTIRIYGDNDQVQLIST